MEEQLVARLIEFVESASPTVWAAARGQVSVMIAQSIVWLIVLLIMLGVCAFGAIRARKGTRQHSGDWEAFSIMSVITGIIVLALITTVVNDYMALTMNPDYYAIKALTDLLR